LDQKIVARKAKARKSTAELAGNVLAKVERQNILVSFFFCHLTSPEQSPKAHQNVEISPHNSAGMKAD
jgi:hypothetical protein